MHQNVRNSPNVEKSTKHKYLKIGHLGPYCMGLTNVALYDICNAYVWQLHKLNVFNTRIKDK